MRVGHEVPRILPGDKGASPQGGVRQTRDGQDTVGQQDTVQISAEARDLHTGGSRQSDRASSVAGGESERLAQVQQRIRSGFYDSRDVRLALAEEVLSVFGI